MCHTGSYRCDMGTFSSKIDVSYVTWVIMLYDGAHLFDTRLLITVVSIKACKTKNLCLDVDRVVFIVSTEPEREGGGGWGALHILFE